jgi:PAS domain S-box-containing protein
MFKLLRNRILAFFLLVPFLIVCLVFPINYVHNVKEIRLHKSVSELSDIYIAFMKDQNTVSEFLSLETTNHDFFQTGESTCLDAHKLNQDVLLSLFSSRQDERGSFHSLSDSLLSSVNDQYLEYCQGFDTLVRFVNMRGYRNHGIEGDLRALGNKIENVCHDQKWILRIKHLEWEYLNSNDPSVFQQIINESENAHKSIAEHSGKKQQVELSGIIDNYLSSFQKLVDLDKELGLRTGSGLRKRLSDKGNIIETEILTALSIARLEEETQLSHLNMFFAVLSLFLFTITIVLSIYLSKYLVNNLEQLTRYISQLAKNNFDYADEHMKLRKSTREIREIYREFRNMVAQIKIREKQRDKAIIEVQENERRYRELADLLPQSIFETDSLGNLIYVNKAWYSTFGYNPADLDDGLNLIEIVQTNTDNSLFSINRVENSDYIAIRKDNTRFPALVYADSITKEGRIQGRRGIIIDATLRNKYIESLQKETAKAVSSDKLKSSFLANMSHEIRTPMNSIIGFSSLLSSEEIPEDQKEEFIQHIQSSGKLLLNIIDDIIDIAKIEAGEIKIKSTPCNPENIIMELVKSFEGYKAGIGKSHIELLTDLPEENIRFRTDSFRLKQILSNLISNAIKFTEKGRVTISCIVKNERLIEFAVEDTGMGLTKEDLNIIFTRFKRTNRSETKNISGTGLGLAISKNLVELLGGHMWVSSIPGEGSRFNFQLPYIQIPESEVIQRKSLHKNDDTIFNWSGRTILIAEDDESSFLFLKEVLQKTNARVVHAVNGKEVVEAVKFTEAIDIVLMDMYMPYIDGYAASKMIKQIRPSIPIIAQTAYAMEGDREKAIMAGCDDYLAKPINPLSLLAKINQFMPLSKPGKAIEESDKTDHQGHIPIKKINHQ